jgi:hypothetical protein
VSQRATWLALVVHDGLVDKVLVAWLAMAAVYAVCVITSRRQSGGQ